MSTPSISNVLCQVLLRCAATHGLDGPALCARIDLDVASLADPEGRISLTDYYGLLELLAEELGDPQLGLKLGLYTSEADYDLLGFLFCSSTTVGQAHERLIRYQRLLTSGQPVEMKIAGGKACFYFQPWGPIRPAHRLVADAFVAETILGVQMLVGPAEAGFEVDLTRPPMDPAPYMAVVGVCPTFSSSRLCVRFDAELLYRPVPAANPALSNMLERQAELRLRLLPRETAVAGVAGRVQVVLLKLLPDGVPRMEQVAKRLGQSLRSLQRHLRDEGRSLKNLIEELRRELSQDQLLRGVSILEVAFLVGFSEVSSFHRAFKRWTGKTPGQWKLANGIG